MMRQTRRAFLGASISAGVATLAKAGSGGRGRITANQTVIDEQALDDALKTPVLNLSGFAQPVIIESIELLKGRKFHVVRTRSKDGAVGFSVPNEKVNVLYPVFLKLVAPYFRGKDARDLESLLDGVYVFESNYKMQSLALWCCVAWMEFSILDLLGRMAGKHVSEFFGGRVRERVPIYVASGNRETTPEEEVAILQKRIAETGAKAVKFKVGGRMSRNRDSLPHRSEELIELSRKTLGSDITIQADANGSYDVAHAVEIGRRLEAIDAYLFEEPCPFDHFEETKEVADTLTIPVSGGEQESSEYRFRWMIQKGALQIVQPDLHYYGGFVRSTRVARMAAAAGLPVTTHISSGGTGFADMTNFFSFTPNMGRFQELKSGVKDTGPLFEPEVQVKEGYLNVATAPGLGLKHSEELLEGTTPVSG